MTNNIHSTALTRPHLLLICVALFLFAVAIRTLTWQDNRFDAWKVQTSVTHRYKESARQLASGDFKTFLSDVPRLGHPPGYPILLAGIIKTVGESDTALQFFQIAIDSAAVVVLFLISLDLFSLSPALVAGLLAAWSPQFAYFSVLLLPDSLIVFPILLATYLVVKSRQRFNWSRLFIAGLLIGLSCWLRANALLLPLFVGVAAALTTTRSKRVHAAIAVIAGAVVAIAPVTIKNAFVFHRFIPLSLGSGQTLLEGLADYDPKGMLNIPNTDLGLMRQEAQWYGRPDYAVQLFGEDGIERDRMRVRRGLKTIGEHPLWFVSVMARRAIGSTRLDPVPVLQAESPVSRRVEVTRLQPLWSKASSEWLSLAVRPSTTFTEIGNGWLRIEGVEEKYGLSAQPINVAGYHDYVFTVPVKLERGRIKLKVIAGNSDIASTYVETNEIFGSQEQPSQVVELPFVSANHSEVRLVIANSGSSQPALVLGRTELFDLGPSSMTWLRYLRLPLRLLQKFFTTAWTIPFLILGLVLLIRRKQRQELTLLLAVPAYYLIVQSALHTERRYVYVIHFFFLVLVSLALCWCVNSVIGLVRRRASEPSPQ